MNGSPFFYFKGPFGFSILLQGLSFKSGWMWGESDSFDTMTLPICPHSNWHHFFSQHFNTQSTQGQRSPLTLFFMAFFKDKLMPRGTKHRKAIENVAVITKCSTGETWPIRLYYANVRTLRFYGSAHYNLSTFLKELHAGFPFGRNGLHAELHYIRMQGVRCDLSLNLLWFVCFAKCQPTLIYPPGIWNYK